MNFFPYNRKLENAKKEVIRISKILSELPKNQSKATCTQLGVLPDSTMSCNSNEFIHTFIKPNNLTCKLILGRLFIRKPIIVLSKIL